MAQQLNAKAVQVIMKQRGLVQEAQAGKKKVLLTVQGNGVIVDVKDKEGAFVQSVTEPGTVFRKMIFNVKANSDLAMRNPLNTAILKDAVLAERAGEAEKAHELYNSYLNKVQVSFSIPLPSKLEDKLSDGVEISARVEKITTDNGSLLTIDPKTISIVEPDALGKTTFDLDALLGTLAEEEPEAVSAEGAALTAADALTA
jgi:hypothetical protein